MKVIAIIPARLGSTRLPRKVLRQIHGKSLIQRVYEQVSSCLVIDELVVAVDHQEVFEHVLSFGGNAIMTDPGLLSGTDRCAEVSSQFSDYPLVINVQGDEPFISHQELEIVVNLLKNMDADIASLMVKITEQEQIHNPNVVKLLCNHSAEAMYFSRAAIPFNRSESTLNWSEHHDYWRHIGVYGFKREVLLELCKLPESQYEKIEKLEQLRWLEAGYKIKMGVCHYHGIGIDTEADLELAEKMLSKLII
ncbi:MAG: 3-deoxy-manno-octulosonate cytidylyltransferase [Saprospiraceae bacterium]|nr:3-deoxy-manno-octulosonate cytidylyltransferase [Saprospiraceae bacterium]MBK9631941.1 3-deoxy-manno-octulosonate cytidylyltransferase [Saprospiraceae bacterium]